MSLLKHAFGVVTAPVYCTKIASKLTRTYTDRHGLKDLVRELLGVELSKQQQSSDWGADTLSEAQLAYAASDVLHLHALHEKLETMLARRRRQLARPVSSSCPIAPSSISLAGARPISSPTLDNF
jgi:ribonuclease D